MKKWRDENRDKTHEYDKKWRTSNPDKIKENNRKISTIRKAKRNRKPLMILSYIYEHENTYCNEVAENLGIDRTTTNRIINNLHERGFITFKWKHTDARITFLEVTA